METSGKPTLPLSVTAEDVPHLARVFEDPGPFCTVYLTTEARIENAAQRSEQRWKDLRRSLAERGAVDETLAAIDPLVADAHLSGQTLGVVVGAGGVLAVEHHPEPPAADLGVVGPLPRLGPMLAWRQSAPAHVVVMADRKGADIVAVTATGREIEEEAGGGTDPLSKSKPGGWSQRRFQERVENVWEHNADDVAETVSRLAKAVGARLVMVGGDERAVALFRDAVPVEIAPLVREIGGGRAPGTDTAEVAGQIATQVATAVAEDTVALLHTFRQEYGQHDRAANGVVAVVGALQMAQVETLLVHDDPADERTLWFGPEAGHLATDRQSLIDMGAAEQTEARLVDVVIRAALGSGAGVRIVPSASIVGEGVGAVLRFAT